MKPENEKELYPNREENEDNELPRAWLEDLVNGPPLSLDSLDSELNYLAKRVNKLEDLNRYLQRLHYWNIGVDAVLALLLVLITIGVICF